MVFLLNLVGHTVTPESKHAPWEKSNTRNRTGNTTLNINNNGKKRFYGLKFVPTNVVARKHYFVVLYVINDYVC